MKRRIPYEQYNPALSVKENAMILGCSIPTIKRYIKTKSIDRKYDSSYIKWKNIRDFNAKHPNYSLRQKSEELGYSINTIRKYQAISATELDKSIRDTERISQFDIKNRNSVKSFSDNQAEILLWIMSLYNGNKPFEADLTYSKGVFYKDAPQPENKFDKYPQIEGVKQLDEARSLNDASFSSVIYDLPFIIRKSRAFIPRPGIFR